MTNKVTMTGSVMGLFRLPIVWGLKLLAFMSFVGIGATFLFKDRTLGNALLVAFPVIGIFSYYLAKKYDEKLDELNGW